MKRMGKALSEKQLRFPEGSKKKKKGFSHELQPLFQPLMVQVAILSWKNTSHQSFSNFAHTVFHLFGDGVG